MPRKPHFVLAAREGGALSTWPRQRRMKRIRNGRRMVETRAESYAATIVTRRAETPACRLRSQARACE
jgi:hypothetical protein